MHASPSPARPAPRRRRAVVLLLLLSLGLGLAVPAPVSAQWAVYDVANHVENIQQALRALVAIYQRIEQIRQLIAQVEWMYEQLEGLEDPTSREVATLLYNLGVVIRHGDALVYSLEDLAGRYEELFRGWEAREEPLEEVREQTRVVLDTAQAALLSTRRLSKNYVPSQQALGAMKVQLEGAETQAELVQASGLISAWVGEEVSKLLQQTAVMTNLLAVELAQRVDERALGEATWERLLEEAYRPARYDGSDAPPLVPVGYPGRPR